jgi:hypothetical protein
VKKVYVNSVAFDIRKIPSCPCLSDLKYVLMSLAARKNMIINMALSNTAKALTVLLTLAAGCNSAVVDRDVYGESSWHKYVRSPSTWIVKPKSFLAANITGSVFNPHGFLESNNAPTILSPATQIFPPSLSILVKMWSG